MAKTFKPIWQKPPRQSARAGVASGAADAESGDEGTGGRAQALRALDAMHKRGLIDGETYSARRAEILAGKVNPGDQP